MEQIISGKNINTEGISKNTNKSVGKGIHKGADSNNSNDIYENAGMNKNTAVKKLLRLRNKYMNFPMLSKLVWKIVRSVIITGICFIILYPIIIKLLVSLMDEQDLYDLTVKYVPKHVTLDNFKRVWKTMKYPETFLNSSWLSILASILQLISCTIIGYGFARFKFRGKSFIFGLVVLTMVVPPQTQMIPLFLHFRYFNIFGLLGKEGINLLDTPWPFVLLSATGMAFKNGLYIYLMRQFFRGMPKEFEEAAYVDGAGLFRTFMVIMLPNAVPIMTTVFLFSFVWQWTDTFYTNLFLNNYRVLPLALSTLLRNVTQQIYWETGQQITLTQAYSSQLINTGSLLVVVPLIVIYVFTQRYFVETIERSGLVG